MKNKLKNLLLSLSICLFISASFYANATIWRINNQSQSSEVFTSIQDAIDDDKVFAGDTLLLEASPEFYDGATLDKRLVILGSGYFLDENPETGIEGITAIVDAGLYFRDGSQGSVIQGLIFSQQSFARPNIQTSNILLSRCYFRNSIYIDSQYLTGITVVQSYFENDVIFSQSFTTITRIIFNNNIVKGSLELSSDSDDLRTFASVENNLFLGDVDLETSTYRNNIWLPLESSTISVSAAIKEHNLNISVDMGAGNNNRVINSLSDLYTGDGTSDSKWKIKDNSQYKNSGKDGTDPGPFGGAYPYVLSGLPPLPVIYELSTTGFGSETGGLPVLIKVKSN
jgi:hypothetical protein